MKIVQVQMPRSVRTVASKYLFDQLVVGGGALVDAGVLDAGFATEELIEKAKSRLNSALVAYKSRTGDTGSFSIRAFLQEDGSTAVGCWKTREAAPVADVAPAPVAEAEAAPVVDGEFAD